MVKKNPLHFQQGLFHSETSLVASKGSIGADSPVTWNQQWEWIVGQSCTNGTSSRRLANLFGNALVSAYIPTGDPVFGT